MAFTPPPDKQPTCHRKVHHALEWRNHTKRRQRHKLVITLIDQRQVRALRTNAQVVENDLLVSVGVLELVKLHRLGLGSGRILRRRTTSIVAICARVHDILKDLLERFLGGGGVGRTFVECHHILPVGRDCLRRKRLAHGEPMASRALPIEMMKVNDPRMRTCH